MRLIIRADDLSGGASHIYISNVNCSGAEQESDDAQHGFTDPRILDRTASSPSWCLRRLDHRVDSGKAGQVCMLTLRWQSLAAGIERSVDHSLLRLTDRAF